jgi:hypothetical protein
MQGRNTIAILRFVVRTQGLCLGGAILLDNQFQVKGMGGRSRIRRFGQGEPAL